MQRLKTISLVQGESHEEIISNLIKEHFIRTKDEIEIFFNKETAQNNQIPDIKYEKPEDKKQFTKRETDIYMIPQQFNPPKE